MPPRISVTSQQQRALEALEWLHSDSLSERATGRSLILSIHYLRRLFMLGGWLSIRDHVDTYDANRLLTFNVLRLARELGIEENYNGVRIIELDHHSRDNRMRLFADRLPWEVRQTAWAALFNLGWIQDSVLPVLNHTMAGPMVQQEPENAEELEYHPVGTKRRKRTKKVNPEPTTTLWDHLTKEDPDAT
jgi:hypothetical protein